MMITSSPAVSRRSGWRSDKAEIVFVGYGIQAPEYQWDDFKGADLRGKVLLMMNNDPSDDPALFGGSGGCITAAVITSTPAPRGKARRERSSFIPRLRPAIRFKSCRPRGRARNSSWKTHPARG